jgi:hypothetical protein
VVHHVVEFVKLNQMALVNPLTNQDERFRVYQLYGLGKQLERKESYELLVQVQVFIVDKDP